MKIPDAYFNGGLGQKIAAPAPVVQYSGAGGQAIAQAGQRIADGMLTGINAETEEQGQLALLKATERKTEAERIQRENDAELKRLERAKVHGQAQGALFSHENTLTEIVQELTKDKEMSPKEKKEQFIALADNTRANFIKTVPEEYQHAFAPAFNQHRFKATELLDKHITSSVQDDIKAQLLVSLEELKRTPKQLVDKLVLAGEMDWASAGFSATQQAEALQKYREDLTSTEVVSRFNREDPKAILKDLTAQGEDGTFQNYSQLEPKTRESLIHTAKSRIEQQEREEEAEKRRRKAERNETAKLAYEEYKDARTGLLTLDPKREAELWRAAQGTPYFERMRDVRKNTAGLDFLTKKISDDPLKFGAAQMGIQIPILDTTRPDSWPAILQTRGEIGKQIKAKHGLSYIPILTNDEAKGLAGYLESQAPQNTVKTLENLTTNLGSKNAGKIAQQFAAHSPELGTVAGLIAVGKTDAAASVANGFRLIKDKAIRFEPGLQKDMQAKFDSILGDALTGMPQARATFFEATKAAYVHHATATGLLDSSLDKSQFEKAVKLVTGETVKINGKRVLMPTGIPESQFKDFFKRIDETTIKNAGGVFGFSDPAEAANAIRGDAKLLEAGEGRYRFTIDGKPIYTADGKRPFELEIGIHGGNW